MLPYKEEDQIMMLLGSLPSSYSTLVTALEARDAITLTVGTNPRGTEAER